ncbi:MAG: hypothetical protein ABI725_03785 [Chloroflexota bacterium]
MEIEDVRQHAQAYCDALLTGDVDRAITEFSQELQQHLGELISQIPLPLTEAEVESVEPGAHAVVANLRLVGASGMVKVETRWKDRDGTPTMVEASHVVEKPPEPPEEQPTEEA